MKYCIVDVNNLVHRSKHAVGHYDTFDECVGMVLSILFGSLRKTYEKFGAEHCVACFDSSSWRKEVFPEYKADRKRDDSPVKLEEDEIIHQVLSDLRNFLEQSTNVTVLYAEGVEADDFVARWTQLHHHDGFTNVIISADGDFKQLVREGVELYDPIRMHLYTIDGVFYQDGYKAAKDQRVVQRHGETWKVKINKEGEAEFVEPEWELFVKCIRGKKNNLKSAYPRVRTNKMREAFDDKGGPKWNDFINSMWGEEDNRQSVRERYDFNRNLMDLRRQPANIVQRMDRTIDVATDRETTAMIGAWFNRFCTTYGLVRLKEQAKFYMPILSAKY